MKRRNRSSVSQLEEDLVGQTVIGGIGGVIGGVIAAMKGANVMEYTLGLVPVLTLIAEAVFIIVFGLW